MFFALLLAIMPADSLPEVPPLPPPRLGGTISLGWGVGATRVQGDHGTGYGHALRAFSEWHPWEAFGLRVSARSQEAVGASDKFRSHLVGGGLDGVIQWHRGPFRPRLASGVTGLRSTGMASPFTSQSRILENWVLLVPVEVGAEWLIGQQFSLILWGETQAYSLPGDVLDGRRGGSGYLRGRDELVSAGVAAAYRLDPVRDADRDGVDDRRDRCLTAPEDRDGWQDSDGCPDPDNDKDDIPDLRDRCPNVPEDRDGFQDDDGCPESDNDKDGILDGDDKCPNAAEDRDGFQDGDGCPDLDNDKDGVPDVKDKCLLVPEDRDGFQDEDGCPDLDNDKDGIPDSADTCPREAEDRDGFQDGDGCPEADNDKDGVPDAKDKCLNVPETVNGFQDDDGCPDISLKPMQSMIADRVWFREGSDEFLAESAPAIQELAEWLQGEAAARIEIRAYSDDMGSDRVNQILTQKRAEALRQALISKGVASARVRSRGFGKLNPIASNRTMDGRARNRRIEIFRFQ